MFFYIMFYVPYWSRSHTNSRPGETSVYFYCIPFLILSSLKTSADLGGVFSCVKIIVVLYIHKYSKKNFDSDFPSPCFDVPKASNFTSGGVQNRETKNRRLGAIVTSFQDYKPCEKQISPTFSYFLINNALLYHFLAN